MKLFFFTYKSLSITWFMFFTIASVSISYLIVKVLAKEYKEDKSEMEDVFISLLISGFIGARLGYALMNINLYKDNILSVFKLSHYNLSLIGGVASGLLTLMILSKKDKISLERLLKVFVVPFYFAMSIGIWVLMFDRLLLLSSHIGNNPIKILYTSLLFLSGMILELALVKRTKQKYITAIILSLVILSYYIM